MKIRSDNLEMSNILDIYSKTCKKMSMKINLIFQVFLFKILEENILKIFLM